MIKMDRNCLSYWFPKVAELKIPVPKTVIVHNPPGLELIEFLEDFKGVSTKAKLLFRQLILDLEKAADMFGYPVFLRSGLTSAKHGFAKTCHVRKASELPKHVLEIVLFSHMASFLGLATDVWAVRKMLHPRVYFQAFNGLPISLEVRVFAEENKGVVCHHPYWPVEAFEKLPADSFPDDWKERIGRLYYNYETYLTKEVMGNSAKIANWIGGAWSIDWLWDQPSGHWFMIDMAVAKDSWHWPGCEHEHRWRY